MTEEKLKQERPFDPRYRFCCKDVTILVPSIQLMQDLTGTINSVKVGPCEPKTLMVIGIDHTRDENGKFTTKIYFQYQNDPLQIDIRKEGIECEVYESVDFHSFIKDIDAKMKHAIKQKVVSDEPLNPPPPPENRDIQRGYSFDG